MADLVQQLTDWMDNKATQQNLNLAQIKSLAYETVKKQLPMQYRDGLTTTIFLKAKRLLVLRRYEAAITTLKNNTLVRQQILSVFPNATFEIDRVRKAIIIYMEGQ